MLIRLFQQGPIRWSQLFAGRPRKILRSPYEVIERGLMAGSKSKQSLEGCHRLPPAIVSKDEFVEVNLELIAAHTVVGPDQPLLQVANRAVCQRHDGLRAFTQIGSQWLDARQMLESSFWQSGEALEAIGIYR